MTTSDDSFRVLGLAGSLRSGSFNRALIGAAEELAPPRMQIVPFQGLADIPMFNADVEKRGDPEPVTRFKRAIAEADALLISTPEYQRRVPGCSKCPRLGVGPPGESALRRKPVAIMGAATGMTGTARVQTQLRQSLVYNDCRMVQRPEVLVADARSKFGEDGSFQDEAGRKFLQVLLENLLGLIEMNRS